jgi:hypothetical protein
MTQRLDKFYQLCSSLFFFTLLSQFFFTTSCPARETDSLFRELAKTHENFDPIGSVCEQAARIKLRDQYPPSLYTIETGVIYGTASYSIGELDVVIFRNHDQNAVLIAEVKCWQNPIKALHKASQQRTRFIQAMSKLPVLKFHLSKDQRMTYRKDQFSPNIPFLLISQLDSDATGFDVILDYTLDELMDVRDQLISCKKSGFCMSNTQ